MKEFVKYTLATLCGLLLAGIATLFLSLLALGAILAAGEASPAIKPHSALRLTLNGELREDTPEDPFATLFGTPYPTLSLREILTAIEGAKENPNIEGIYIEAKALLGATPAMAREIRNALADFKES